MTEEEKRQMNINIKEMLGALKGKRAQILAETLASVAHDQIEKRFTDPLFEREFVQKNLGSTSALAKEVISMACHGLAGVSHSLSFSDGLIGEFSSRVLGSTLSDIASKVGRSQKAVNLDSANYPAEELEQVFDKDVRALATEKLAEKFNKDRTEKTQGPSAFRKFLGGLNGGAKNFVGTATNRLEKYRAIVKQKRS